MTIGHRLPQAGSLQLVTGFNLGIIWLLRRMLERLLGEEVDEDEMDRRLGEMDYLYVTRRISFSEAENISKRSPAFLSKLLEKVKEPTEGEGAEMAGFRSLAPKTKNLLVAGGLSAFVFGVYYYTMMAVGGTDELQVAIDKFEEMKKKDATGSSTSGS